MDLYPMRETVPRIKGTACLTVGFLDSPVRDARRHRFGVRVHRPFRAVGNHAGLFWFSMYRFSVSNGAPPAVPA